MTLAISLLSIVPIRKDPSERSEMISQLLFGETGDIIEKTGSWLKINTTMDKYTGWVDHKMIETISKKNLHDAKRVIVSQPLLMITEEGTVSSQWLVAGSILYNLSDDLSSFSIGKSIYEIKNLKIVNKNSSIRDKLVFTARQYLNTPYLWGGKSPFGIDCSALVQMTYRIHGIDLPRDSGDQYLHAGIEVSYQDAQPGDLAFFSKNDTNVSHVGIVIGKNEIIHASGRVRIDTLKPTGIYNEDLKEYTYRLVAIKKYPDFVFSKDKIE